MLFRSDDTVVAEDVSEAFDDRGWGTRGGGIHDARVQRSYRALQVGVSLGSYWRASGREIRETLFWPSLDHGAGAKACFRRGPSDSLLALAQVSLEFSTSEADQ